MGILNGAGPYIADILVIFAVAIMTAGVIGLIRMPDVYTKLHAASKAVVLGAVLISLASIASGDQSVIMRVILISIALLLTTPVASHMIARSAAIEGEPMESPGAIDESSYHLVRERHPTMETGNKANGPSLLGNQPATDPRGSEPPVGER